MMKKRGSPEFYTTAKFFPPNQTPITFTVVYNLTNPVYFLYKIWVYVKNIDS